MRARFSLSLCPLLSHESRRLSATSNLPRHSPLQRFTRFRYTRAFSSTTTIHQVRVRFAPSPTGRLHLGGLRTALFNYLYAKKTGGSFILRIEDTDRTRLVPGAEENLIASLQWAGLEFDEGPTKPGPFGPYRQSERLPIYEEYAEKLIESGKAYRCFCSPEQLAGQQSYDRKCSHLPVEASKAKKRSGDRFVVRLKMPRTGTTKVDDLVYGEVVIANKTLDDAIIIKSDQFPTYHFANVVDDHLMGITHVLRGQEWITSTPKHLCLYSAFGWNPPQYVHLPLLLNPDRSKLSKRSGDVHVEKYRERGYLPSALLNFVVQLGWGSGTTQEIFTMEELISQFSLEQITKSGAITNQDRLDWVNEIHMAMEWAKPEGAAMMVKEARKRLQDIYGSRLSSEKYSDEFLIPLIEVVREGAKTLNGIVTSNKALFVQPEYMTDEAKEFKTKVGQDTIESVVKSFKQYLESAVDEGQSLKSLEEIKSFLGKCMKSPDMGNIKTVTAMKSLRWSLSAEQQGASVAEIIYVLGVDETRQRLKSSLEHLAR